MENSTKAKASAKPNVKQENENIMKHVVELSERLNYMMDALKDQAEMVKGHQALLERVRTRMGL